MSNRQLPLIAASTNKWAEFSPCRRWRYALIRHWGEPGRARCAFIGLNPSTADELLDDPTVRRCINFATDWGFAGLIMLNLYGWRSTAPSVLRRIPEPIGAGNNEAILRHAQQAGRVVAAWGADAAVNGRAEQVLELLAGVDVWCLKRTQQGHPGHPLYVRGDTRPVVFRGKG